MSKGSAIFGWVKLLAPLILANIPATRPIADKVAAGLAEAEALHGPGTGAEKLAHVVNLGQLAGDAINAEKPGTIDTAVLSGAITEGVNTAFSVATLIHNAHGAPVPPVTP
jgi:hypothetical protein